MRWWSSLFWNCFEWFFDDSHIFPGFNSLQQIRKSKSKCLRMLWRGRGFIWKSKFLSSKMLWKNLMIEKVGIGNSTLDFKSRTHTFFVKRLISDLSTFLFLEREPPARYGYNWTYVQFPFSYLLISLTDFSKKIALNFTNICWIYESFCRSVKNERREYPINVSEDS